MSWGLVLPVLCKGVDEEGAPIQLPWPLKKGATFHPGLFTEEAGDYYNWLKKHREEERIKRLEKKRKAVAPAPAPAPAAALRLFLRTTQFQRKRWFLLPPSSVSHQVAFCMALFGDSLTATKKKLPFFYPVDSSTHPFQPPGPFSKKMKSLLGPSVRPLGESTPAFLREFAAAVQKNQWLRARMAAAARRWLLRRRCAPGNELDPVTLEPPVKPVSFVDWWPARRIYTFEAESIRRDCVERLLLHDQLFPSPKPPRNPFTNLPLTLAQFLAVLAQLRAYGRSHWALESLAASGCSLPTFALHYGQALKFSALRRTFAVPDDEYKFIMMEFIEDEHAIHGKPFSATLYRWALDARPGLDRIKQWKRLCMRYHELNILIADSAELEAIQDREIGGPSKALCGYPADIAIARNTWYKEKLLAVVASG